ncbi:T9SS type A sorting domain-containing protein [Maribacter cobaltidurans]|uniref:Secretion system C-terminal sorting domain-containing protein n=1 Tax=Maribacter cobaltidurans TaxID=1178778 RepID=A0A223V2G3_9FLAO|nr:T9SS type A sorting domain-containing protein [Maribacter cobaltidurans]ASV29512.1 hypothetical protein CJ263_04340 [Maribacter cobaltidurans]
MKRMVVLLFYLFTTQMFSQQKTGPEVKSNHQEVKVFPNPATNVINILGLQNSERALIRISDTYGNTMMNYQWEIKNNALNIPIANLGLGIYLITINSSEQKIQKKFFKQ